MALFDNSPFTPNLKGKVGGSSFSNSIAGRVVKNAGRRTNNHSNRTSATKSILDTLTQAWINLTDAQRAQWSAMANFKPTSQKRNLGHFINGQQFFMLYNGAYYRLGGTIKSVPDIGVYNFPLLSFTLVRSGGSLLLTASAAITDTDHFVNFKISAPMRASRANPIGGVKYMQVLFLGGTTANLLTPYSAAYGSVPAVGQWVFIEYRLFAYATTDFTNIVKMKIQVT